MKQGTAVMLVHLFSQVQRSTVACSPTKRECGGRHAPIHEWSSSAKGIWWMLFFTAALTNSRAIGKSVGQYRQNTHLT